MALLDRVKERSGSDLSDTELQAVIDANIATLTARLGPAGPVTVELGDLSDPHSRMLATLRITPPIATGEAVTIVELDPGNSGAEAAERELDAADYRILHAGRTLQRLTGGPNGRTYWAPLVRLTYTPQGAAPAERDEAVIKLCLIDLSYRGGMKSERAGDYSVTLSGDPQADRKAIIDALLPDTGMMLA
ncbi:MAG: hypothetical protein WA978_12035 [Sphingopyxis granuli]|uniref:hypothetical protein n=1 Tax=Sphingopyxis granuli TaxID=267128 RepID=UPI003C729408